MLRSLVGSEMCIRDSKHTELPTSISDHTTAQNKRVFSSTAAAAAVIDFWRFTSMYVDMISCLYYAHLSTVRTQVKAFSTLKRSAKFANFRAKPDAQAGK